MKPSGKLYGSARISEFSLSGSMGQLSVIFSSKKFRLVRELRLKCKVFTHFRHWLCIPKLIVFLHGLFLCFSRLLREGEYFHSGAKVSYRNCVQICKDVRFMVVLLWLLVCRLFGVVINYVVGRGFSAFVFRTGIKIRNDFKIMGFEKCG